MAINLQNQKPENYEFLIVYGLLVERLKNRNALWQSSGAGQLYGK